LLAFKDLKRRREAAFCIWDIGHSGARASQVGFSRLGHFNKPISGKPEIGASEPGIQI
jgi:hypothetical protein